MPSSIDVLSVGVRNSLAGVPLKSGNGEELSNLDSALAAGNKLAEITKHVVEYEPAENQQSHTQDVLRSKYAVLTKKNTFFPGAKLNGVLSNGTNNTDNASSCVRNGPNRAVNNSATSALTNGQLCDGVNGGHQNGSNISNAAGPLKSLGTSNSNLSNGYKNSDCNGLSRVAGSNAVGNGPSKSQAMSDSTLPQPKRVLYDPDNVTLGWKGNRSPGAGMLNMGNTCYLNATLQALFHVPAFIDWLTSDMVKDHIRQCRQINGLNFGDCITCSMAQTYEASQKQDVVKPYLITNKLKLIGRQFSHGSQEDAHEFMRHLLENLERAYLNKFKNEKLDPYSMETTPINQIFGGYIRNEVKCLRCSYISTTFQHFQDLILDIRKASKVEDAIDQYFRKENLVENSYKCEKCKCTVSATKKFSIEKPPKVLCIQLKRFNQHGVKLPKPVEHRSQMDLKRHIHPQSSSAKYSSLPYRLISMVTHVGPSSGCGHYTAIAQSSPRTFHLFDDAQVRPLPLQAVLNYNAYILIYEMDPQALRQFSKTQTTSTASTSNMCQSNQMNVNGTKKNLSLLPKGLPAPQNRDRVAFGLTPPKPVSAQPRIVIHSKKPDATAQFATQKTSINSNGSLNKDIQAPASNFIGPVQVSSVKKQYGVPTVKDRPVSSGILKLSDSIAPHQSDALVLAQSGSFMRKNSSLPNLEADKRHLGSLVPYDCDDDSSSRDSSLSPPLSDDHQNLTVKATSGWQVTNSPGLQSPSIHSESSNHSSVASTGSNWNVTEKQPENHASNAKYDTAIKDQKERLYFPSTNKYSSDPELESQTDKAAPKCHIRAKSIERTSNLTPGNSKTLPLQKNARVRRSSISSGSDSSSSSKIFKKKSKVVNRAQNGEAFLKQNGNKETPQPPPATNGFGNAVTANRNITQTNVAQHSRPWNGEGNSSTVNDLLKMSHQGFGSNRVSTWNGDASLVERSVDEERQASQKRMRDEYEEELDRGKTKKVKKEERRHWPMPYLPADSFQHRNGSPFHNYHQKRYNNHSNYNYHKNRHHGNRFRDNHKFYRENRFRY